MKVVSFFKLFLAASLIIGTGCIKQPNTYSQLPPGMWRGVLKLADPSLGTDPFTKEGKLKDYFELPFNFEVTYDNDDNMSVHLINGEERIEIEDVQYGRDRGTAKDTIRFNFLAFDTYIDGFYEENIIEGNWIVNYKENYKIPFIAFYGESHRFLRHPVESNVDINGTWDTTFEFETDDAYPAIAELTQKGNDLNGTFMTETGDYRFLNGNVYENKLKLSVFDGAHAFLFAGNIQKDTIYGEFRSGNHYKSDWKATRSSLSELKDPYKMTNVEGSGNVKFELKDSKGMPFIFDKDSDKGKIVLLNIMGTWCPNCRDESEYLKTVQTRWGDQVEIYSIAFERYRDESVAVKKLDQYKNTMDIPWTMLLGGYASKQEASDKLEFLDKIYSYPTLVMLDENHNIKHIHTGFYGPATSKHSEMISDLDSKISNLIKDNE